MNNNKDIRETRIVLTKQQALEHPWDVYWARNQSGHSFESAETEDEKYLADFWKHRFSLFPKQASVIDLGTGNGALVARMHTFATDNQCDWTLSGVDIAAISPCVRPSENVAFYPNTSITALPFNDHSQRILVSQFAIEYADLKLALGEADRVLCTDGKMYFICHATDSVITRLSHALINVYSALERNGLYDIIDHIESQKFVDLRSQLLTVVKSARAALVSAVEIEEMTGIMAVFGRIVTSVGQTGEEVTKANLRGYAYELLAHRQRLQQQIDAAQAEATLTDILKTEMPGRKSSVESINVNGHHYAWFVEVKGS